MTQKLKERLICRSPALCGTPPEAEETIKEEIPLLVTTITTLLIRYTPIQNKKALKSKKKKIPNCVKGH